jgi:hypothetical protein
MRQLFTTSLAAFVLAGLAAPAAAQGRPERPYRGLFGSQTADLEQSLRVSGTLGGVYDTDLAAEVLGTTSLGITETPGARRGSAAQFSGSAAYSLSLERVDFSASASSSGRYYPSQDGNVIRRDNVAATGSAQLGLGFSVGGSAGYRPFTATSLYEAFFERGLGESSADFDFGASGTHYVSYAGDAGWQKQLTRRTFVSANYEYRTRAAADNVPQYRSQQAGGGFRYNLGRGFDLKLGYGYTAARYSEKEPIGRHLIDAGVDYSRALSFSRRTTLSFTTGTVASENPGPDGRLRLRAVGSASLNHEIGRTWNLMAHYGRNLRFDENWMDPIFSDSLMVNLSGLLNRRFQVHARAGTATGRTSLTEERGFDTYFFDTGLNFGIGRFLGIGTSYRYHNHTFAQGLSLASGIAPSLERHSVQAYLSLWAPIFERTRRP